ncbi:plasmid partitioning protein RepB [Bosea sp. MMO-172]|uniref:plasmid partitioning protein RepB n=1 Tax=Bosea sp. MMO-172 TaxID=3127885 RepID=UPI0030198031
MARKNPFANLVDKDTPSNRAVLDYTTKGASRSILNSLDEMAARADRLAEGETVVDLDPDLIDVSFVRDRRTDDDQEFDELLSAIRDTGQNSPILVRPHPKSAGRYMTVFGHRRLRVAKELGRKVRAIVKEMEDREHVLALGQENSARANVPFIERALFAADVARLHYDDDNSTILSALSIDRATLSKMLSVATLPAGVLAAIGQAKGVGRDRWYELKLLLDNPANHGRASEILREDGFVPLSSDERFHLLVQRLKVKPGRKRAALEKRGWTASDKALSADILAEGKKFTLALKAKNADAHAFGAFLSDSLDRLYEEFRRDAVSQRDGG